ncbi:MAG TPA: hypothetical protein VIG47_03055, partial [Gemmatimonadaceae bacterium]
MTTTISARTNPFFAPSSLPFQAPPFDQIQEGDYLPAIQEGMKQQLAEVARISANPEAPTFANTLVALERSGALLNRVMPVFSAVTGANTSDELQKVQQEVAPQLAAHEDSIFLDEQLFDRVGAVYGQREALELDPESGRLLEWYYDEFVRNGARLGDSDKAALKELNKEASTLNTSFANRLLAASKAGALVVTDVSALAGLNDDEIAAAALAAQDRNLTDAWLL